MDVQDFHHPNKMRKLLGKFTDSIFDVSLITQHISISDKVPARVVLYFLSWSGFLVSFVMRNDINLAIVEMVKNPSTAEPFAQNGTGLNSTGSLLSFDDPSEDGKFDWSNSVQSFILSSFYLFYVVSQVKFLSSTFIQNNSNRPCPF